MSDRTNQIPKLSRRALLKSAGFAPLLLRPAPFWGASIFAIPPLSAFGRTPSFPYADTRFKPHYPTPSPLADVLRLVPPGSDEYVTEKYAFEIEALLDGWGTALKASIHDNSEILKLLPPVIEASSFTPISEIALRAGFGIDAITRKFGPPSSRDRDHFLEDLHTWLGPTSKLETVEFEIYRISEQGTSPLHVQVHLRYDLVAVREDSRREERVGSWQMDWSRDESNAWKIHRWEAGEETLEHRRLRRLSRCHNAGTRTQRVLSAANAPRHRLLANHPRRSFWHRRLREQRRGSRRL